MKLNRILSVLFAAIGLTAIGLAQAPAPAAPVQPLFIKGSMNITFATRVNKDGGNPRPNTVDTYNLNVNVSNSALFRGTIKALPFIKNTLTANQLGAVIFDMDADVINPRNPSQTRNVGKLYGKVPVDDQNVYHFDDGTLRLNVFGIGQAKGFESKATGLALAKPPVTKSWIAKAKEAIKITSGKGISITLTKYDKMELRNHTLVAGPVQIYPEVQVSGNLLYDYDRSAWYFQNVLVVYSVEGRRMSDSITGNIRWVESPNRKTDGVGEYQFDIRVNEPLASESAVFAGASDESAFFTNDEAVPGLVGTMKYKDTMGSEDNVISSTVLVDLQGNKLSKQQIMYLTKLLFFTSVVPFNAE